MTVEATVDSTLNGQQATLIVQEYGVRGSKQIDRAPLSGGTETVYLTDLDGGHDKEYNVTVELDTSDVTQTSQVPYGLEVDLDPTPARSYNASSRLRDDTVFDTLRGDAVAFDAGGAYTASNGLTHGLLSAALNDGEVLADDGYVYGSIQDAQDNASSWIFIGPGTFDESVSINTDGLSITGSGYQSIIDGGGNNAFNITAIDVSIQKINARSTDDTIVGTTSSSNLSVHSTHVTDSGRYGIQSEGGNATISNCTFIDNNTRCIQLPTNGSNIISNNSLLGTTDSHGIALYSDDNICASNTVQDTGTDGIRIATGSDQIIIGNRINNSGRYGIDIQSTNNIIANNRVSNSSSADINTDGTGTELDANNTNSA